MLEPLNKTFLGGSFPTLGRRRGSLRQRLAGMPVIATSGSSSFTATKACRVLVYAWGGGGGGDGAFSLGGGGGAAIYHEVVLRPGQSISWSVGAAGSADSSAGGNTTVTLPGSIGLTAGGGSPGSASGLGGVATGAMINRKGNDAVAATGGQAASFPEHATDIAGGAGGTNTVAGVAPGGGGGNSAAGAAGRVILIPFRLS